MKRKRIFLGLMTILLAACTIRPSESKPSITPKPTTTSSERPSLVVTPLDTTTAIFTPSPTPTPEVRLMTGDEAFDNGDYIRAQTEFQAAFSTTTDSVMRAVALWGLGRVEYAAGNKGKALADLNNLATNYPENPHAPGASFLMGEIYLSLERYSEAITAYTTYLAKRPGFLDSLTQERLGDAYNASGNYKKALSAYQEALSSPHIGDDSNLQLKIAQSYVNSGDIDSALNLYKSISEVSSNDTIKAQVDLLVGRLYLSIGQTDQAYANFMDAVTKYPLAYDSYSALVALVNANIPVDELNRGLVDYFAGQYGYAADAFTRYIAANPENDGTAVYYKALAFYALGQYEDAVQLWDIFIQNYPDNPHWAAAWNGNSSLPGRAYTQWWQLNQYATATQTLLNFIKLAPNDPNAPIYLMEAASIQERDGKLEDAAKTWERVADEYPSNSLVPQALFQAGITRYRNLQYDKALFTFRRGFQFSSAITDQARANFWIGKTQQVMGDLNAAQTSWQQAASLDPTDYYSLRSQDMLLKQSAFEPPPAKNLSIDIATERTQADAWMRVTFKLPTETDLGTTGSLLKDLRLIRGTELWNLGLENEARLEFEDLRTSVEQNPADSYRLANYLLDLGLIRPAIIAIRQVLTLAGMADQSQTLASPAYFNHIRYGLYYQDLVLPIAEQSKFDPLFIFAVMRQESLFEGFVRSSAGARGLMQITPDTGKFISDYLDWPPDYTSEDLYRPLVSITLGIKYLENQRSRFNGDFFTTLAAYNAGPEAASIWRDLSGPDDDLFLETIRFEETRSYIISIYEIYNMYRSLYGTIH